VPSTHGLLTTFGYQLGPKAHPHYALEGSIAVAGLGISWLKDNLRLIGEGGGGGAGERVPRGGWGCAGPDRVAG
jgi:hypothetical protein